MTTDDPSPTPIPEMAGSSDSGSSSAPLESFTLDSFTLDSITVESIPPPVVAPAPTTSDDINLLLTTSIEKPEPDPMLGSADSMRLDIGVQLTPSPDAGSGAGRRGVVGSSGTIDELAVDPRRPPYSWTTLLLASYSSAVTMALVWVLVTNRGFKKPVEAVPPPPAVDWGEKPSAGASAHGAAPSAVRAAKLGSPLIIGDLEVKPVQVRLRDVNLVRLVDPKRVGRRSVAGCLVMTLQLSNRSSDRRLTPLELATVRNTGDAIDGSFIESATGERIGMLDLAMESEWSIEQQSFPSIEPGRSEDVILVSEPIHDHRLASPLVWRVKVQTDAGESEEIAVQFDRQEIGPSGP